MKYALGIDIGGTNIKALALTPSARVLAEMTTATGDSGGEKWIANVKLASEQVRQTLRRSPAWMGLAAPGIAARDQRSIRFMPERLQGLEGLVWRKVFKAVGPVPVLNDAQAALLGEVWRGAARGARNAFLLTLGTGVGGAALVDGRLLRGHIGRAGHLGHLSLDPAGPPDVARTPGSLEDAIGDCSLKARTQGRFDSTEALVAASKRNDRQARRVWLKSVQALAAAIASLINVLDPEVVIIGGGIAKAGPDLFRPLKQNLARFEWRPGGARARVVRAKLGDRAGAFGAAWNAIHFQK
jgi:glucokinase